MSRPSKAKRELRRKALLLASQEGALHSALVLRHKELVPDTRTRKDSVRSGLGDSLGKALYGPRHWSAPEIVKIASRDVGRVEAKNSPHYVAEGVRPTKGQTKKRSSLDGFTPKMIDALLSPHSKG